MSTTTSILAMIGALVLGAAVSEVARRVRFGTNGNGSEKAGEQNKNYWLIEFARIGKESLIPVVNMLMRIEQNQVEILRLLRNLRAAQKRNFDDDFE
jgi:hypothetical protein